MNRMEGGKLKSIHATYNINKPLDILYLMTQSCEGSQSAWLVIFPRGEKKRKSWLRERESCYKD